MSGIAGCMGSPGLGTCDLCGFRNMLAELDRVKRQPQTQALLGVELASLSSICPMNSSESCVA